MQTGACGIRALPFATAQPSVTQVSRRLSFAPWPYPDHWGLGEPASPPPQGNAHSHLRRWCPGILGPRKAPSLACHPSVDRVTWRQEGWGVSVAGGAVGTGKGLTCCWESSNAPTEGLLCGWAWGQAGPTHSSILSASLDNSPQYPPCAPLWPLHTFPGSQPPRSDLG